MSVDTDSCLWVEAGRAGGSPPLRAFISSATKEARSWAKRKDREKGSLQTEEKEQKTLWENKKVMRPGTCRVIARQHEGPPGR